jgi:hypothetical protein
LVRALDGAEVLSPALQQLGQDLLINRLPELWRPFAFPTLRQLSGYGEGFALKTNPGW